MLESLKSFWNNKAAGTTGMMGRAIRELQGLKQTVVAGAAAGTVMTNAKLGAMEGADTLVSVINLTDAADDTANCTIFDRKASGTVTFGGAAVAADTVTVAGLVYTYAAAGNGYDMVTSGAANAAAAALAAAINTREGNRQGGAQVQATVSTNVVTVKAVAPGTGGNALTLAKVGANITVSGATLAGGSATGGFKSTSALATKNLLVTWFDKQ